MKYDCSAQHSRLVRYLRSYYQNISTAISREIEDILIDIAPDTNLQSSQTLSITSHCSPPPTRPTGSTLCKDFQ